MKNLTKIGFISLVVANSLVGASFTSGATATASGLDAIAIGEYSTASSDMTVAIGERSTASGYYAVANGYWAESSGLMSVATGYTSFASGEGSTAYGSGARAVANYSTALGSSAMVSGLNSTSIGYNSNTTAENSVSIGNGSFTDRNYTFSVGSVGFERQIVNVANGTQGTDAVNLNQLQSYSATTLQNSKDYTDLIFSGISTGGTGTTINNYGVDEAVIDAKDSVVLQSSKNYADTKMNQAIESSNSYTDAKVSSLEQTLTKDIRTATATSIALGVTPQFVDGGKNAIGMGLGNYEGQNAIAINSAFIVGKGQGMQIGASLNASHQGYKAGYSVSW